MNKSKLIVYENLQKVNNSLFPDFENAFKHFLDSGKYILGENVSAFEREFALYCGVKYCVGVASGLDALILALEVLELEKGDEIILPSNTYIAPILAAVRLGLKPVLVEPDVLTYNINPSKIEEKITSKTKAIIAVHLYGKLCDVEKIIEITRKYNLKLIEDASQAHGAKFNGRKAGSFGDLSAFSFYPTKNLGCLGDGGAVVTSNSEFTEKILSLRNYGTSKKYYNDFVGYNSRLDEIQACFLRIKLQKLDEINSHKKVLADFYDINISNKFIKPIRQTNYFDTNHIYNIRFEKRDELKMFLENNNVFTEIHYPIPPHFQKSMNGILKGNFPISEEIHNSTLSLPISYSHKIEDLVYVVGILNLISK